METTNSRTELVSAIEELEAYLGFEGPYQLSTQTLGLDLLRLYYDSLRETIEETENE